MAKNELPLNYDRPKTKRQFSGHIPIMEKSGGISMTIPDMSMSISKMMELNKKGLPISSGGATPIWNGTRLLPNWKAMDEIDRQAVIKSAAEQAEKLKAQVEKLQKSKEEKDAAAKAEFEKHAAEMRAEEIRQVLAKERTGA